MINVGIGELKARLRAYIQRAPAGQVVVVTNRGEPVAELRARGQAAGKSRKVQRYEEAVAAGWLHPPSSPADRSWLEGPSAGLPAGTAAALLDAD